ncbi:hypothetical protein PI124_g3527 [Phytophthora idaei]|nr:hypothetical protein PI125_g2893 [Phytophthora idaei]KAG3173645.1 hypothetical protein PI126_g743 [Phytophthora idaei]KAG3251872.1 hypothetical protein PI124_g3527 [Phytophthora idaei]
MTKTRSAGSVSTYASAISGGRHFSLSKKKTKVYCVDDEYAKTNEANDEDSALFTAKRLLLCVWVCGGLVPLFLQARSYIKFVTPHKITQDLVVALGTVAETGNLEELAPLMG